TLSQTYDGSVKTVQATTTPSGLAVSASFTGTPQAAGSYPVTVTINDPNYVGTVSDTLVIAKAPATVNFVAGTLSQTYDGSVKTVQTATTPSGLTVNVAFTGTPQSAGNYPVTVTISDPNYVGTVSDTLVIAKAPATVNFVAGTLSQTYDGSVKTVQATT